MPASGTGISYEGKPVVTPIKVFANVGASQVISEGMLLCYDADNSDVKERYHTVEKPSLTNARYFAGWVAPGVRRTGPGEIDLIPYDGMIHREAKLRTDESITAGDLLGVIPGSFYAGKCVYGSPIALATETVDRTTTPGTVTCHAGQLNLSESDLGEKIVRIFDHFIGDKSRSATADAGTYILNGTGATAVFINSGTASDQATAAQRANGALLLSGATTGWEANLTLNGEPFTLATGKSLFFCARFAVTNIDSEARAYVGLALDRGTTGTDATGTDYIMARVLAAVMDLIYAKDGTGSALATATGASSSGTLATLVAAEYVDVAFLVRNKLAGTGTGAKELTIWVNGVEATHTFVPADLCDNESLTLVAGADDSGGDSAQGIALDRWEVQNYFG